MKPILAVMIGISGSGKSTYANGLRTSLKLENKLPTQLVETDAIRGELTNDPSDQTRNGEVFSIAKQRTIKFLKMGENVIVDATSPTPKDRKTWIDIGKACNSEIRAYYVRVSIETAKKQNLKRTRVVPDFVIDKQFSRLTPPKESEGFDLVTTIG